MTGPRSAGRASGKAAPCGAVAQLLKRRRERARPTNGFSPEETAMNPDTAQSPTDRLLEVRIVDVSVSDRRIDMEWA